MSEPMIKAIGLTKTFINGSFETEVLRGVDFELLKGQFISIMGPSGSGKSTLIGILAGLDSPSTGNVYINGTDITELSEASLSKIRGEMVGYVFQTFNLINTMSALENVELPMLLNRKFKDKRARAERLLSDVGLKDRLHYLPTQLSGGQQQRVSIARALACDPAIIIADEPTGNLDSAVSEQIIELLESTVKKMGKALIIVTHDAEIAARADKIFRIKDGILTEEVPKDALV